MSAAGGGWDPGLYDSTHVRLRPGSGGRASIPPWRGLFLRSLGNESTAEAALRKTTALGPRRLRGFRVRRLASDGRLGVRKMRRARCHGQWEALRQFGATLIQAQGAATGSKVSLQTKWCPSGYFASLRKYAIICHRCASGKCANEGIPRPSDPFRSTQNNAPGDAPLTYRESSRGALSIPLSP